MSDVKGRRDNAAKRARVLSRTKAAMPVAPSLDGPRTERAVDAELESPVPKGGIVGVLQQPYLLRLLVRRQLAQQYAASLLGFLWSYIQPAFRFVVYFLIFGYVFKIHQGTPNFAIHLFCGIVFVHYFSETVNGGVRSIWSNRSLVKKMAMPREIFPVSSMLVAAYHTLPQFVLLSVICVVVGITPDWTGLAALLLGIAIIVVFSTAIALLLSAVNVYYRDFQNIVATLLQMIHFMVPMMYPISRIQQLGADHPVLYQLYMANPACQAVLLVQRFFWYGTNKHDGKAAGINGSGGFPPDMFLRGIITLVLSIVLLWLCQKAFSRLESKFPERI
ncbi:transport permease protein [Marmoricola endophyticus]|uniref:Transport permease protein n=1 Tax=Marmoricola endophyticus TaxID=2040280 RepID=A0A917F9W8_9ACTN|nr:ABC transporter permease [Marmoricola endophyticus]GGF56302.1 transport permease protein [Marmoricola endophyticus]